MWFKTQFFLKKMDSFSVFIAVLTGDTIFIGFFVFHTVSLDFLVAVVEYFIDYVDTVAFVVFFNYNHNFLVTRSIYIAFSEPLALNLRLVK